MTPELKLLYALEERGLMKYVVRIGPFGINERSPTAFDKDNRRIMWIYGGDGVAYGFKYFEKGQIPDET